MLLMSKKFICLPPQLELLHVVKMMKIILPSIILFCSNFISQAQDLRNLGVGQAWHAGRITLADGIELNGWVRNNDKEGIISFKEEFGKDSTTRSFRPPDILALEYNDRGINRKFYSLETKDKTEDKADIYLYEVIREYNSFAIVSFQGIVDVVESKNTNTTRPGAFGQPTSGSNSRTVLQQVEEIYFINESGERELYLILVSRDIDGLFDHSANKGKVLDSSIPVKYFGEEKWNKIKIYLKDQNLKIKTRENLISMLNYYETLIDP